LKKKITIITVNFNNLEGLKKTLNSVFSQSWKEFEYIIIDGASTDGSVDLIKNNEDKIDLWISNPDKGVYNAMNKGIEKAQGEYLLFLNSGDHFFNNSVIEKNLEFLKNEDVIYSNLQVVDRNKTFIKEYPEKLSFSYFVKDTLPHPATFIKKKAFEKTNLYNENFKIVADWKFFIDAICKYNLTYKKVDTIFSVFYLGGMSSNIENRSIKYNEIQQVLTNDYPMYLRDIDNILVNNDIISNLRNSRIINLLVKLGFLKRF
jgi:glycosyltransferase involved in cell wall biosynthesis